MNSSSNKEYGSFHTTQDEGAFTSQSSGCDANAGKRKAKISTRENQRKVFDQSVQMELELEFQASSYLTAWKRQYLSQKLNLTERQVRVWFQNRRMRIKHQHRQKSSSRVATQREGWNLQGSIFSGYSHVQLTQPNLNPRNTDYIPPMDPNESFNSLIPITHQETVLTNCMYDTRSQTLWQENFQPITTAVELITKPENIYSPNNSTFPSNNSEFHSNFSDCMFANNDPRVCLDSQYLRS